MHTLKLFKKFRIKDFVNISHYANIIIPMLYHVSIDNYTAFIKIILSF